MSAQNQKKYKDMTGVFFKNTRRNKENSPNWTGKMNFNGKEFLVSMWEKDGNADMMTFSITDPDTLPPRPDQPNSGSGTNASEQSSGAQSSGAQGDDDIFSDLFGNLGS